MALPIPPAQREFMSPYLSDLPGLKVVVVCRRCDIRRQFDGMALLERIDADCNLPTLIKKIARGMKCELALKWKVEASFEPQCQMRYDAEAMDRINAHLPNHRIGAGCKIATTSRSDRRHRR